MIADLLSGWAFKTGENSNLKPEARNPKEIPNQKPE
jgi:hypothetical protein